MNKRHNFFHTHLLSYSPRSDGEESSDARIKQLHSPTPSHSLSFHSSLRNSWSPIEINKQTQFSTECEVTIDRMRNRNLQCIWKIVQALHFRQVHRKQIVLGIHHEAVGSHVDHRYHRLGRVRQAGCIRSLVLATQHLSG